jgi:hypothetical protein
MAKEFGLGKAKGLVSARAGVEGCHHSITYPRGGRSVRCSPVKGNGAETRGYRNRCTPLSDGKHEPRND